MRIAIMALTVVSFNCSDVSFSTGVIPSIPQRMDSSITPVQYKAHTWQYFLQHLPQKKGPVVDYRGREVGDQQKFEYILDYDIGNSDLQQCADALMRLRAEYLFSENRWQEIGFYFTDGTYYSFSQYCKGSRPFYSNKGVKYVQLSAASPTHASLRKYLNIVYMYAGTLSLSRELLPADGFRVGTVVIKGGSPGHCFIIIDEATDPNGNKLYKLAEGYTPAQSIYVLKNTTEKELGPWHRLTQGAIITASYAFYTYKLGKFE